MVRLKLWQWGVLALPVGSIVLFILFAAGTQIHEWGLNWIWAVFTLILVGWRWLLVRWTTADIQQMEALVTQVQQELEASQISGSIPSGGDSASQAESVIQAILKDAEGDRPIWEDWATFWTRCQTLINNIAHLYHPEVKYPLLNIYIPQASSLMRGTVDDLDRWLQRLSPALNQVTLAQAYQGYEVYRKLEPSARKLFQALGWAQWLLNPAAAVAKVATQKTSSQANQQLLINLGQMLREAALRNLARQAVSLYSGNTLPVETFGKPTSAPTLPQAETQTLREILSQAQPVEQVQQKPLNILLVGRTGAGKSSVINTLFQADQAEVDVLPSTDQIKSYHWRLEDGESLTLWDTPGYEQVERSDYREAVLEYAETADLLLLVTPALDPALQMDADFLQEIKTAIPDLPVITIVTQVDRLRPIREWNPPYDWVWGEKPKEKSIREATQYRGEMLGEWSSRVLPLVTYDGKTNRQAWGDESLSLELIAAINPAKQQRLARFLRNQEAQTVAAAKIIDRYTFQMSTTQGLTALLKSPVLQFVSTLTTGQPTLAYLLAERIPVEQLPIVIGKLQMAYDLFSLFDPEQSKFDLLALWPLLLENPASPEQNAWAFGHALVEYWTQNLTIPQLQDRYRHYCASVART